MTAIDLAIPLIKRFEGCVLHSYRDPVGIWTIGYGLTKIDGKPVTMTTPPLTMAQADDLLRAEVEKVAGQVEKITKPPVADHEMAALISFTFNLGITKLGGSTLIRLFNAGDRTAASDEFPKWVYAGGRVLPGLVRRRAAERAMFLNERTA